MPSIRRCRALSWWHRLADHKPPRAAVPSAAAAERFGALALPALDAMYRLARALSSDRSQAADLVQETYTRALRYFDSYRGEQDIRAWLAGIMRNVRRDAAGLDTVSLDLAETEVDPAPDPEANAIAQDRAARLRRAIADLPEPLRETLMMREFTGLSYAAIATALGIAPGTVMSRLSRARALLRETMER